MSDQKTGIGRVVSSVVDVQQTMLQQFEALSKGLEALKIEHHSGIAQLREDLRRSDDRAQKQCSDMSVLHNKEMERLHQIIHTLLARDVASAAAVVNPQAAHFQQQQQAAMQTALLMQRQMEFAQAQAQAQNQAMVNMLSASQKAPVPQQPLIAAAAQIKPQVPIVPQTQPVAVVPKPTPPTEVTIPSNVAPAVVPQATVPIFASSAAKPAEKPAPMFTPAEKPKPTTTITTPTTTVPAATGKFTFGSGTSSIFGKKPETAAPVSVPSAAKEDDEEENTEEYEPEGDFKPVIPLPDLVEVKTGEEGEQVMFNNRAKLYIYFNETNEWKERGTGELKVLYNKEAKKWRVVMRRDQVLKVCANFPIVGSMTIQKMATNEKAYTWFCEDFSEDEPAHVKLSARFANVEIANEFKSLFEKAVAEHKDGSGKTIDSEIKPAAEVKKELKVEPKEVTISPSNKENGFGDKFKPKPGSWECKGCYITNKAEDDQCVACQTNKDGTPGEKNIFSKPSILQPAPGTPKVTFGFGATAPAKEPLVQASQFGASLNGSPSTANNSIFGGGTPKTSIFSGTSGSANAPTFSFNAKPTVPSFNFNSASPAASTPTQGNSLFGASKTDSTAPAPTFSFSKAADTTTSTPKFAFGNSAAAASTPKTTTADSEESKTETPKNVFGSFASGGQTFASLAAKAGSSIFDSENAQKAQKELASLKKTSVFGSKTNTPTTQSKTNDEEGADVEDGDYEPEVDFKPVIPLPDLVEVKTGEEDEEVMFTARCKLYKYYSELSENKERGVGDIKILKNKENKYRIVMRREQVHKLCANFRIEKSMKLTPKPNLPQVLTFMCQDFSEDATNADTAIFTAKFKDETIANSFKTAVQEAQATM